MKEFIPCTKCKQGYIYSSDSVIKCSCLKQYQSQVLFELRLEKAGLKDFNLTFKDYKGRDLLRNIPKLEKYCSHIQTDFRYNSHLYLTGINGTQKSTLAKVILLNVISQGLTGKFILMSDLLDILTDVYSDDPRRQTELDYLLSVDVLCIDDAFDKHKVLLFKSGYQLSFVDRFIRSRIEIHHRNIIFTSNVEIDKIADNGFTKDVQDLLYRSIKVRNGELLFNDIYVKEDVDIKSLWD